MFVKDILEFKMYIPLTILFTVIIVHLILQASINQKTAYSLFF